MSEVVVSKIVLGAIADKQVAPFWREISLSIKVCIYFFLAG
jgi:hypothetical protein